MSLDDGVSRFGSSNRLPTPYLGGESGNRQGHGVRGFPHFVSPWIIWGAMSAKVKRARKSPKGPRGGLPRVHRGLPGMVQGPSAHRSLDFQTCVIIIISLSLSPTTSSRARLIPSRSRFEGCRGWVMFLVKHPSRARPCGRKLRKCSHHGIDFLLGLCSAAHT